MFQTIYIDTSLLEVIHAHILKPKYITHMYLLKLTTEEVTCVPATL